MVKTNHRKVATLFLGLLSSAVSGCVTGYVEGTEDYLKFCIERQPSPSPAKCPKQAPADMELLIVPSKVVRLAPDSPIGDVKEQSFTFDS
ncbi:hypothetical protein QIJ26_gp2 [ssRNA phage Zoerhiza.1_26]|uniref:Lipoprotein n=2 Tax=Fiersviridae TaxID=2842319 RepID=A0A8S5L2E1_9VIRU|nr:hypothetical protein QIJ26_gp2 [ssRNA phage Zoerhiza.1_26]QDH90516.1 MAG: hypothetical protein H1Rhizo26FD352_000004 [Leviviridae sp.]DAD51784.1 TPA_asm: hypothetical protein [ssRNA phage Zoerhiza.1_26]